MTEWLDHIAGNLLRTERDIRVTLRAISRREKPEHLSRRLSSYDRIEITTSEARTLLHGAMPAPITVTRLREPHARLVVALAVFHAQLLKLNDPFVLHHQPEIVLQTAMTLVEELQEWHRVVQWRMACKRARVKFPLPPRMPKDRAPGSISQLMQLDGEQTRLTVLPPWQQPRPRRQLGTMQAEFDFGPPPPTAEIIDLRQLQLFTPEERHHGKAA